MIDNKKLNELLNTPMSRKQFLKYIGIMALSLFGVSNVINSITSGHNKGVKQIDGGLAANNKRGFGSGKYGT